MSYDNEIKTKNQEEIFNEIEQEVNEIEAKKKSEDEIIADLVASGKQNSEEIQQQLAEVNEDKKLMEELFHEFEQSGLETLKDKLNVLIPEEELLRRNVLKAFNSAKLQDGKFDRAKLKKEIAKLSAPKYILPEIVNCASFCQAPLEKPPEIIQGVLHKGCKLSLSGGSKSYKTWSFLNLAVSVATGLDWLGFKTTKAKVLYLNFEIGSTFIQDRLNIIREYAGIEAEELGNLELWNLRGFACDYKIIIPKIIQHIKNNDYGLIILDPIYKLYGDADENKAGDVANLLNSIEKLATDTGSAVAFGAHFSKGNQSGKNSIDRVSGSGVFARDPDSIITLTAHEQEDCFSVETTLRNLAPIQPFVVRWNYPIFLRDNDLDATDLKANNNKKYSAESMLTLIKDNPLISTEWQKAVGCGKTQFHKLKNELIEKGKVVKNAEKKWEVR